MYTWCPMIFALSTYPPYILCAHPGQSCFTIHYVISVQIWYVAHIIPDIITVQTEYIQASQVLLGIITVLRISRSVSFLHIPDVISVQIWYFQISQVAHWTLVNIFRVAFPITTIRFQNYDVRQKLKSCFAVLVP